MKRLKREIRDKLRYDRRAILAVALETDKVETTITRQLDSNHELLTTFDSLRAISSYYSTPVEELLEDVETETVAV